MSEKASETEGVLVDLFEALTQLCYPGISQVHSKDFASTVLSAQNRMSLLSWLLKQSSVSIAEHLEKYKDASLNAEIVKCFTQMGLCTNENALRGECTLKQQIPTLRLLLQFIVHLNEPISESSNEVDVSTINEIFEKRMNEELNIIPASLNFSSGMNYLEANKYLDEIEKGLADTVQLLKNKYPETDRASKKEDIPNIIISCPPQISTVTSNGSEHDAGQILSLTSNAAKYAASFDSISSWPKSKSTTLSPSSLDDIFQSLHEDLCTLNQALSSKAALLGLTIPKDVDKTETPLTSVIEDNAICTEEASDLLNVSHIEC